MKTLASNRLVLVLVIAGVLATAAESQAKGVLKDGKALAERVCAQCHLVAPDQKSANSDVPSFMSIAAKYKGKPDVLRSFLIEPHRPMPDLSLKRQEILDLIAYIESL